MTQYILIFIILSFLTLLVIGGFFFYKKQCPEGIMKCFGLESSNNNPANFNTSSSSTPTQNRSNDYTKCTRYFREADATKTCYDPSIGKGGVRWYWSATPSGNECEKKTGFYKIEVTSAYDNHSNVYEYIKPGGGTNGIIFENALGLTKPSGKNMNLNISVTPLDEDKKVLSEPLVGIQLNPGDSVTKECTPIGTSPFNFFDKFTLKKDPIPDNRPPAPPPPENCEYDWKEWSKCTTDIQDPICDVTWGKQKSIIDIKKQPKFGGTKCPTVPRERDCIVTEGCTIPLEDQLEELPMCSYTYADRGVGGCISSCTMDPNNRHGGTYTRIAAVTDVNFAKGKTTCNPDPSVIMKQQVNCPQRRICPSALSPSSN
jgi:hypothetical protein